ncbi:MAG: PhnD/SsuA/transferrin family substrate-binding protein [Pseudomonadota bacterium]
MGCHRVSFARLGSGIALLQEMQGKLFGDPTSTSCRLVPSIEIPKEGSSKTQGNYFGDGTFAGGQEQTIVAVAHEDIRAGSPGPPFIVAGASPIATATGRAAMFNV